MIKSINIAIDYELHKEMRKRIVSGNGMKNKIEDTCTNSSFVEDAIKEKLEREKSCPAG